MPSREEIEARLKAATPGPWEFVIGDGDDNSSVGFVSAVKSSGAICDVLGVSCQSESDADFIAHAPTDIAALLSDNKSKDATIESLRREKDEALRERDELKSAARQAKAAIDAAFISGALTLVHSEDPLYCASMALDIALKAKQAQP